MLGHAFSNCFSAVSSKFFTHSLKFWWIVCRAFDDSWVRVKYDLLKIVENRYSSLLAFTTHIRFTLYRRPPQECDQFLQAIIARVNATLQLFHWITIDLCGTISGTVSYRIVIQKIMYYNPLNSVGVILHSRPHHGMWATQKNMTRIVCGKLLHQLLHFIIIDIVYTARYEGSL